ncbi:HupE/UreJ family protein [Hyphomicrobium sp.]|uniref:HupE/UreJ family protein n=1 Tax=Hyphomicrobium sp. TaxID=82 RepID=UPI002E319D97|nr:HupE/UreJ family protein [Hyphomicrobium sp.]HEX2842356.1 HupE/UreJ family protein [Hyphomicrobium sp.]
MANRSFLKPALAGLLILSSAVPASAHVGHGETHGLMHGFMHPIGGADHMLAMIAVGMLAAALGGRALWLVPASFMAMMAVGAGVAMAGIHLPFVELGISLSVVALGLTVALRLPLPIIAAMGAAGFFAIFHGYAHGAEMPIDASGASYAAGFLVATGLLHLAGIAAGTGLSRMISMQGAASRVAGGAIALAGLFLAV